MFIYRVYENFELSSRLNKNGFGKRATHSKRATNETLSEPFSGMLRRGAAMLRICASQVFCGRMEFRSEQVDFVNPIRSQSESRFTVRAAKNDLAGSAIAWRLAMTAPLPVSRRSRCLARGLSNGSFRPLKSGNSKVCSRRSPSSCRQFLDSAGRADSSLAAKLGIENFNPKSLEIAKLAAKVWTDQTWWQ